MVKIRVGWIAVLAVALALPVMATTVMYMSFDDNLSVYNANYNHDWGQQNMVFQDPVSRFETGSPKYDPCAIWDDPNRGDWFPHFQRTGDFGKCLLVQPNYTYTPADPNDPNSTGDVDWMPMGVTHATYPGYPVAGNLTRDYPLDDFTLECWAKWNGSVPMSDYHVAQVGRLNDNFGNISLRYHSPAGQILATMVGNYSDPCDPFHDDDPNTGFYQYTISGGPAKAFEWAHVAVTYEMGDKSAPGTIISDPNTWDFGSLVLYNNGMEIARRDDIRPGLPVFHSASPGLAPFIGFGGNFSGQSNVYVEDLRFSDEVIPPSFTPADPCDPYADPLAWVADDVRSGFWGPIETAPEFCGDVDTLNPGDVDGDCITDLYDFTTMFASWGECTNPGVVGCQQLDFSTHYMEHAPAGGITIDGNTSDWAGIQWFPIDTSIYSPPVEIGSNSQFAACWDANDLYIAAYVEDPDPCFMMYSGWDRQDMLEVYVQASGNGDNYGAFADPADPNYMYGQQIVLGLESDATTKWAVWGDYALGGPIVQPGDGIMQAADYYVGRQGPFTVYEVKLVAYEHYNRNVPTNRVQKNMVPGETVRFDFNVVDRNPGSFNMASYHFGDGKFKHGSVMMEWQLVNDHTDLPCGAWGAHPADVDEDCSVDISDVAAMAADWLVDTF